MIFTLPWPSKELSPNARGHWAKKYKHAQKYKAHCYFIARQNKPKFTQERIDLEITFNPPDDRPRDLDNMLASIKSGLDAIAEAWGVNDKRFALTLIRGLKTKHGAVNLTLKDTA